MVVGVIDKQPKTCVHMYRYVSMHIQHMQQMIICGCFVSLFSRDEREVAAFVDLYGRF